MGEQSKPSVLEVNILYLLLGISLIVLGTIVQRREIYSGLLITEYILILLPNLLFLKFKNYSIKKVLKLNRINFKQIIMVILITIFTYPLAVFLQAIFLSILSLFKEVTPSTVPLPYNGTQYIISFFIIALTPGICEEIMFRGVVLNAYERLGHKKSIIISAFLFSIFHFNLLNMIGPFILGIVFGIMVYKTNSIYTSIIGHTINNGIALTLGYLMNKYYYVIDELGDGGTSATSMSSTIKLGFSIIIFLGLCLIMVIGLLKRLSMNEDEEIDFMKNHIIEVENNIVYESESVIIKILKYIPIFIIMVLYILVNIRYVFV